MLGMSGECTSWCNLRVCCLQAKHTYRLGDHAEPAESSSQAAQAALWRVQHFAAMLQIRQVMLLQGMAWERQSPSGKAAMFTEMGPCIRAVQLCRSGIRVLGASPAHSMNELGRGPPHRRCAAQT